MIHRVTQASALWSCPVWNLSQRAALSLRASQTKAMASHLRWPRASGESDESYAKAVRKEVKQIKTENCLSDLDVLAFRRLHSYAGHVARRIATHPDAILSRVLLWNRYQHAMQSAPEGRNQGFRRFSPWSVWEYQFVRYYWMENGQDWMMAARDKKAWRRSESDFVEWRLGDTASNAVIASR